MFKVKLNFESINFDNLAIPWIIYSPWSKAELWPQQHFGRLFLSFHNHKNVDIGTKVMDSKMVPPPL